MSEAKVYPSFSQLNTFLDDRWKEESARQSREQLYLRAANALNDGVINEQLFLGLVNNISVAQDQPYPVPQPAPEEAEAAPVSPAEAELEDAPPQPEGDTAEDAGEAVEGAEAVSGKEDASD